MSDITIVLTKKEVLLIKSIIGGYVTYKELQSVSIMGSNWKRIPKRELERSILKKLEVA